MTDIPLMFGVAYTDAAGIYIAQVHYLPDLVLNEQQKLEYLKGIPAFTYSYDGDAIEMSRWEPLGNNPAIGQP